MIFEVMQEFSACISLPPYLKMFWKTNQPNQKIGTEQYEQNPYKTDTHISCGTYMYRHRSVHKETNVEGTYQMLAVVIAGEGSGFGLVVTEDSSLLWKGFSLM